MPLSKKNPTHTKTWAKLKQHFEAIKAENMNAWFAENEERTHNFQLHWGDFFMDYSKNRIAPETQDLLLALAEEMNLKKAIHQQFSGEKINETENRAVLHTALRGNKKPEKVEEVLQKMKNFSQDVISGRQKGYSGKEITDVVNIGIGGSDLGPRMVVDTLKYYGNHLNVHFVSNVDGDQYSETCKKLNPETTLVIIVSKSFSTQETLTNAKAMRSWFLETAPEKAVTKHFVAVSSNMEKVTDFGITEENSFPMWDWVGGRFSLWSAVGLSICCAIGFENFEKLLNGAQKMDEHFSTADFDENIPVILGMLSIWYANFFETETEAIIPYSHYMEQFVPYLQQAVMESNGKSIARDGKKIAYQTGTIVWGATGSNAQHAFFQLIHQGTKLIPCDFIGFRNSLYGHDDSHNKLMANFFAQTEALLKGRSKKEMAGDLTHELPQERKKLNPFQLFEGNKPSTTILIDKLTPENLGSLIALYEHKIFVQGVIWNIFSYDQWGVELGKKLASGILNELENGDISENHDASTASLLRFYSDK